MSDGRELVTSCPEFGVKELDGALAYEIAEQREIERRNLKARVQHSQKLESLGVLAGAIAHDFNNLLTGILGNAGMALRKLAADSACRPLIEEIEDAARHAAALSSQMLAYSGNEQAVSRPVDLKDLIDEMAPLLRVSISKKASLRLEVAEDLPAIESDPSQLRQVIINLITNASESLANVNGVISLTAGLLEADRAYLDETDAADDLAEGPYVYLAVSDTGCGIPDAIMEHLFDPAFTTKSPGRGLGLAAVRGIVHDHQGAIKLDSVAGRGTTFKVLFAASDARLEDPVEKARSARQDPGTILVVDDEKIVRDVAERILEDVGYQVLIAEDGLQALEIFEQHAGDISLVLLDMTMPRLDGAETFLALRRLQPDLRVILTSGFDNEMSVGRCANQESVDFLQKPYLPAELIEKIRSVG